MFLRACILRYGGNRYFPIKSLLLLPLIGSRPRAQQRPTQFRLWVASGRRCGCSAHVYEQPALVEAKKR